MHRHFRHRAISHAAASVHFWLSLLVGLQVLVWTFSGLFMSAAPIERVRSEHRLINPPTVDLARYGAALPAQTVLESTGQPVSRLSLEIVGGQAVYVAETAAGAWMMFDARTGARLSPIDADFARRIAGAAIRGAAPERTDWIADSPPIEYRGDLPVWRVAFDDAENLAVYVSPDTGRIIARRSDLWRVYDFLWALHIMDYESRENFNHAPLIVFASASVAMSIAGLVLLILRAPRRFRKRRHPVPAQTLTRQA